MIIRTSIGELQRLSSEFPIILIIGPRQSGKTTLAKYVFSQYHYVTFEDLDTREYAISDPRGFLLQYSNKVIFDEIQRVPEILSYIQSVVDESNEEGMYVFTGSHNYLMMEGITQTLAGRVGILQLLPLSYEEILQWDSSQKGLDHYLVKGSYPRIYSKKIRFQTFYQSYLQTYVERDLRLLKNIGNLETFIKFLKLCAGQTGQLLNLASLGEDCGIAHKTAKSWISVLEASFIIFRLPPYYQNFRKRLVKQSKLYFFDTGLLSHLLGIRRVEDIAQHYLKGQIFESMVISELMKLHYNRGRIPDLYFWRDNHKKEIDLITTHHGRRFAIEIKSGLTLHSRFFQGLQYWQKLTGDASETSILVYGGEHNQVRSTALVYSWQDLEKIFQ